MPTLHLPDLEMYYTAHGPANGEPLILLHSFLSTGQVFNKVVDQLSGRYRLYIPDWRGHGHTRNPLPEIHHAQLARDTAVFAAALGLEKAHFCGYSSGGMHLPFVALAHPELVHSLTLVASTYTFNAHCKSEVSRVRAAALPKWIEYLNDLHHHTDADTLLDQWVEAVHRPNELPFTPADLSQIACPTLIIHGDHDNFFPLRIPTTMAEAIPQAELHILPGAGHLIPEQHPEAFVAALLDFLGRNPF